MDNKKRQVDFSYRKRLTSLTTHLRKYEKPNPNGYDAYCTSYITSDIPWKRILQDESIYSEAELPPFTPKFEIGYLAVQEKERKLRGESIRKKDILPSTREIMEHFKEASTEIASSDRNQHLAYLYFKAMQYSEVNKAQALDERYPKPECDVIRSTYSPEHQAAVAATLRESSGKVETPFHQREKQLLKLPEILSPTSESSRMMATEVEREDLFRLRKTIREALGSPMLIKEFKFPVEHWQFKSKAKADQRHSGSKKKVHEKVHWKKNVYPPKSREDRIAELRGKTSPIGGDYLETDDLPGLWKPELMIPTFKTKFTEAVEQKLEDLMETEDDWSKIFQTNKKCLEWLQSIPDSL